ncbi:hypothetical protein GVAV_001727 [Gurleya vavrai]
MFNQEHFKNLFNDTHDLIKSNPISNKIKLNIAALKALVIDCENESDRQFLNSQIDNIQFCKYKEIIIINEILIDKTKMRLEKELLGVSRELKSSVLKLDDLIGIDANEIKKVEKNMIDNIKKTELGVIDGKKNNFSVLKWMVYCILLFFVMYFLIRFG